MVNIFTFIGIICTTAIVILLAKVLLILFKNWRKNNCKFKCLCKHTFSIEWLTGFNDMGIKCTTCGKFKVLHFDKNSLKTFRFNTD
jgi:hypothetical protein